MTANCNPKHVGRCKEKFTYAQRGDADKGWHAHHVTPNAQDGPDTVENCRILCIPCHKKTDSYGTYI